MATLPTQNYVLIQFKPKAREIQIHVPDGSERPMEEGDAIVVLACGPDVPKEPPMGPGTKVILRQDANHAIYGMSASEKTGLIKSDLIIAVVREEESVLTDAEIDAVANGKS